MGAGPSRKVEGIASASKGGKPLPSSHPFLGWPFCSPSFNRVTSTGFGRVALLALLRKNFSRGTDLRHNLKLAIAVKFGTQLAFARAVGIHPIAINKICQGWKEPTAVERERIATALKADSAWLFSSVTRIPSSEVTPTGSPAEMTTKSQTRSTFDDTLSHSTNAGQGKESPMHAQTTSRQSICKRKIPRSRWGPQLASITPSRTPFSATNAKLAGRGRGAGA